MRLLLKIGGAALEQSEPRELLARSVTAMREAGHELILVHGGGKQIGRMTEKLGLEERFHQGLRVTDDATAEVVLMVLGGLVNRTLVAALQRAGTRAVGLTGADGATFSAVPYRPDAFDLGHVGKVDRVDPELLELLLAAGYVPVLATIAPLTAPPAGAKKSEPVPFFNINADMGAGPLARALGAETLLFLTDVPGVLDRDGRLIGRLTPQHSADLCREGVISGGMRPKIEAAWAALKQNPSACIKIAAASAPDPVQSALEPGVGTLLTATGDGDG